MTNTHTDFQTTMIKMSCLENFTGNKGWKS